MPIFQKKIINKYLQRQDKTLLHQKWTLFKRHFLNLNVQENIRKQKAEQYQGEFLIYLWVNVLGYTKNPNPNYNLIIQQKNVKDAKKADGSILLGKKVIGVIELKDTKTTDLTEVENQVFAYKHNQPDCMYVITSNFEKLRFYIDNAVEHIEFNLFKMTEKDFEYLYLYLSWESISKGLPKQMKLESIAQERDITPKLYQDYTTFKRDLYPNLLKNNPQHEAILLFKKSQKLLDRFLFLFFAEDRELIQSDSIRNVVSHWKESKKWEDKCPLYEHYKRYFESFNEGNPDLDFLFCNGGLFERDLLLDSLVIDDHILHDHTLKLSDYDFNSEIDVNILGHIFENSLAELDELSKEFSARGHAPLSEGKLEKGHTSLSEKATKTEVGKRKKDGVFYTPKYITKYIIDNTVGKLCTVKKEELQLIESNYVANKKRKKETTQALLDTLKTYRDWLLNISIIDPACGAGAFLNEALNFLIVEHQYIDELQANLLGSSLLLSNVEKSILENNLFGVDINEGSIEIAKLSLWLRTTHREDKLTTLNQNIKCGNSLISDAAVAGEKAFDWHKEFPKVFEKGGFDVVVGNPPYVRGRELEEKERKYLERYTINSNDTAILFLKKGIELINDTGLLSYIIPKSFLYASNWSKIRHEIYEHLYILIDCGKVWHEVLLEQVIFSYSKEIKREYLSGYRSASEIIELGRVSNQYIKIFNFLPVKETSKSLRIALKIKNSSVSLNTIVDNVAGVPFQKHIEEHGDIDIIGGAEFNRYEIKRLKGKIAKKWVQTPHAFIKENSIIVQNIIAHILNPTEHIKITACIPDVKHINKTAIVNTVNQLIVKEGFEISKHYLWCILNSTLINWYVYHFIFALAIRTLHFYNPISEKIPFKYENINQAPFIEKAGTMLRLYQDLQGIVQKFQRSLVCELGLKNISTKLENWYQLGYGDFLKELEKQKISLKLSQKQEWEEFFESEKQKAQKIQTHITQTDKEIDSMVYALYNLSNEEIAIIEQ